MPTLRAFSAKTIGKRPLPASRPTGPSEDRGSRIEDRGPNSAPVLSGCFSRFSILGPRSSVRDFRTSRVLVSQAEVLLDAAQVAAHLGQFFQADQDALLLALGRRGGTEEALARRHVAGHAGLG